MTDDIQYKIFNEGYMEGYEDGKNSKENKIKKADQEKIHWDEWSPDTIQQDAGYKDDLIN